MKKPFATVLASYAPLPESVVELELEDQAVAEPGFYTAETGVG